MSEDARPLKSQLFHQWGIAAAVFCSRLLAFGREILIAQLAPAEVSLLWILGFRWPNLLRRWVYEGGGVVPLSESQLRASDSEKASLRLHFALGLTSFVSLLIYGQWVSVDLSLGAFWAWGSFGFYSFLLILSHHYLQKSVINQRWSAYALWPVIFNLVIGLILLLGLWKNQLSVSFLGWALMVAGLSQFLCVVQWQDVKKWLDLLRPKPGWALSKFNFAESSSTFFIAGAFPLYPVLFTLFHQRQGLGQLGPLFWAEKFIEVPIGIVGASFLVPLRFSRQESEVNNSFLKLFRWLVVFMMGTIIVSPYLADLFLGQQLRALYHTTMTSCLVYFSMVSGFMLLARWMDIVNPPTTSKFFFRIHSGLYLLSILGLFYFPTIQGYFFVLALYYLVQIVLQSRLWLKLPWLVLIQQSSRFGVFLLLVGLLYFFCSQWFESLALTKFETAVIGLLFWGGLVSSSLLIKIRPYRQL